MIAGRQTDPGAPGRSALLNDGGELRPVGDLENRGISQVRLISQSQFDSAVREALAREILAIASDLTLANPDRELLIERAHARLAGKPIEPTASVSPPRPLAERSAARAPELEPIPLDDPEPSPHPESAEFDVEALENRIVEEVGRLVSQNWREELRTAQDSQRNVIYRLEGRIDSLMKALDQIERLMDHQHTRPAEGMPTSFIDSGALGGIKNELMEQLFEANLALRELEAGEEG